MIQKVAMASCFDTNPNTDLKLTQTTHKYHNGATVPFPKSQHKLTLFL